MQYPARIAELISLNRLLLLLIAVRDRVQSEDFSADGCRDAVPRLPVKERAHPAEDI